MQVHEIRTMTYLLVSVLFAESVERCEINRVARVDPHASHVSRNRIAFVLEILAFGQLSAINKNRVNEHEHKRSRVPSPDSASITISMSFMVPPTPN